MGGGSGTETRDQSSAFISPQQMPFLQNLFQMAQGQAQGAQGGFNQLPGQGQQLAQQGQGFVNQLGQAGQQANQGFGQAFNTLGQAGQSANALGQFAQQGTTDQQIQGVQGVAQNFLDQNLRGIRGQENLTGQFGGGRGQVAQGAAIGQAAAGLGGVTADILGQDMFRRQQAQLGQGQLQGQIGGLQGSLAGQQGGLGGALAGQGIQGLGGIFELMQSGLLGQFGGLQNLGSLIGAPTVLNQSTGKSSSDSVSFLGG